MTAEGPAARSVAGPIRISPGPAVLLEPGADVDDLSGDQGLPGGGVDAHHDLSRVHADADGEPHPVLALQFGVESVEAGDHPAGGCQGPVGVVLVAHGDAEDGHHGVADELLHRSAVFLDPGPHQREVPERDRAQGLRVEPPRQGRGSDEVAEDHGHHPAFLGRRGARHGDAGRSAAGAEGRAVRWWFGAPGALHPYGPGHQNSAPCGDLAVRLHLRLGGVQPLLQAQQQGQFLRAEVLEHLALLR